MRTGHATQSRWLRDFGVGRRGRVRLFCFHHAGGNASIYQRWPQLLPAFIEPVGVQLPGRESRLDEPPVDCMEPLVDRLLEAIASELDRPFAFFGCSMGAKVAFALARALRARGLPQPRQLFVAGCPGPSLGPGVPVFRGPDRALVEYLRELGGTPREFLEDEEFLSLILPTVRADMAVVGTWVAPLEAPLGTSITAFAGVKDPLGSPPRMQAWRQETTGRFQLCELQTGHFFFQGGLPDVLVAIERDLATIAGGVPA